MANYYIAPKSSFDATADAIRAKTGSQAAIEWTEDGFADAIEDIQTGNRDDLTEPKDVDFIDFDGRLLYSYTAQEFLALTALPANPSYPGLTAQGWNWTLSDAKEYVGQWGALVIGQNYTTDDGKTRVYITVPDSFVQFAVPIRFISYLNTNTSISVDWGDETTPDVLSKAGTAGYMATPDHFYQTSGDYIIKVTVTTGSITLGYVGANSTIFQDTNYAYYIRPLTTKVEIGNGVTAFGRQPFGGFNSMKSVSIPTTCTGMDTGIDLTVFGECVSLKGVVFPSGMVGKDRNLFGDNLVLMRYVSVPKTMTRFQFGQAARALRKLTLPPLSPVDNTQLNVKLYHTGSLTHLIIPGTYISLQDDTVHNAYIQKLTIPASVTTFNGNATLRDLRFMTELHMLPTSPPTMGSVNCLGNGNANRVIYVPYSADHSILEAYQTATNWSTYASQMQEEPQ